MPEVLLDTANGDKVDYRWGYEGPHEVVHYSRHPTRDGGGNPWIAFFHGGGGTGNDARIPFTANANANGLFYGLRSELTGATDPHFDVFSVQLEQFSFVKSAAGGDTIGNAHSQTAAVVGGRPALNWNMPARSAPTFYPKMFTDAQRALVALKGLMARGVFDCNPNMGGVAGSSKGAHVAMLSQIWAPFRDPKLTTADIDDLPATPPERSASRLGFDSRVNFVLNHIGQPDIRNNPSYVAAHTASSPPQDVCYGDVLKAYFNVRSQAEWDAIPTQIKEACSLLYFVQNNLNMQWLVPHYCIYPAIGGSPTYPLQLSTVHHEIQFTNMTNIFAAAGRSSMLSGEVPATWDDSNATLRTAVTRRAALWMQSKLPGRVSV
jgi:hypothetical protein